MEPLARQQSLFQAVPIAELNEIGVLKAKFVTEGPLSALSEIIGELVTLEMKRSWPSIQPYNS